MAAFTAIPGMQYALNFSMETDYPKMFATITSIVAVAAISLYLLERLERRLFP